MIVFLAMILIYPAFFTVVILLIQRSGGTDKIQRRTFKVGALSFLIYLFFVSTFFFGLGLDNHYDVQRGTWLWYAVMGNSTIDNFPQVEPLDRVKFHHIGGDGPNIGVGWEVEYSTKLEISVLLPIIEDYLKEEGFIIRPVEQPTCGYKMSKDWVIYTATNSGECLDLFLKEGKDGINEIELSIIN